MFLLGTFSLWDKQYTEYKRHSGFRMLNLITIRFPKGKKNKTSHFYFLGFFIICAVFTVQLPSVNSIIVQLHRCVGTMGRPLTEAVNRRGKTLDVFRSFQHLVFPQAPKNGWSMKSTWDIYKINDLGLWDILLSFSPESTQLFVVDQEFITEHQIHNDVSWVTRNTMCKKRNVTCVQTNPVSIALLFFSFPTRKQFSSINNLPGLTP